MNLLMMRKFSVITNKEGMKIDVISRKHVCVERQWVFR